jgi:hypothetical protein
MRPAQQVYVIHRAHECERFLASALSKRKRSRLVLVRQLCNLRTSKHRPVFAHVLVADVAPAAFSNTAFHPVLKRRDDVVHRELEFVERWQGKLYHYGRSADDDDRVVG